MKELFEIQQALHVKKGKRNTFGKYNFRSAECILEALKPLMKEHKCYLIINESCTDIGGKATIKSTATLHSLDDNFQTAVAYAGVEKAGGMALPQAFGSASSYAKKYALGNLFLIDDTEDPDATNDHDNKVDPNLTKALKQVEGADADKLVRIVEFAVKHSLQDNKELDAAIKAQEVKNGL